MGDTQYDELNLIEPGKNYGWPTCEGGCSTTGMTDPKRQWPVAEASPSAVAYADGAMYMAALAASGSGVSRSAGTERGHPEGVLHQPLRGRFVRVSCRTRPKSFWLTTANADNNGDGEAGSDKVFQIDLAGPPTDVVGASAARRATREHADGQRAGGAGGGD